MKRIIRLTESDLTRIVKRVIKESEELTAPNLNPTYDGDWKKIYNVLKNVTDTSGNKPKIINFKHDGKPVTTLNWGSHSDVGKKKNWGLSIGSDDRTISFQTKDENLAKIFNKVTGKTLEKNDLSGTYSTFNVKWIPSTAVTVITTLIKQLG